MNGLGNSTLLGNSKATLLKGLKPFHLGQPLKQKGSDLGEGNLYSDFNQFSALRLGAKHNDPKTLKAVAQQFEALFIQMALKSMREATDALGKGIFDSNEMGFYQEMFDKQISLQLSSHSGTGLSDVLVSQLSPHLPRQTINHSSLNQAIKAYKGASDEQ